MQIDTYLQRGSFHPDFCEDALFYAKITSDLYLLAVADGCSMGIDSHFASTLKMKFLHRISEELSYLYFYEKKRIDLEEELKVVTKKLFLHLQEFKNQFLLKTEELLSTIQLAIVHTAEQRAECLTIGDGAVFWNQKVQIYEQDNRPDYLAYHLNQEFEHFYQQQQQRLSLKDLYFLSFATDGLFSFQRYDHENYPQMNEQGIEELLFYSSNTFLQTCRKLERRYGLRPTDDLALLGLHW